MNDRDILRTERLQRVSTFGTENKADWPADSAAATSYAKVTTILGSLDDAKVGQLRLPASKQTLLDALWLDFKDIARTARGIAVDEAGFAAPYRVPADATETTIKTHADALLALLEDATTDTADQKTAKATLRKKFTDRFIPADFVEDLRADRDAIDTKNNEKTSGNLKGVESTKDIDTLLEDGGKEVLRLDPMMQNLYGRDPGKLQAWLAASRVERRSSKKKMDDASGTTTPAPTA
jgi:hypothetical protein